MANVFYSTFLNVFILATFFTFLTFFIFFSRTFFTSMIPLNLSNRPNADCLKYAQHSYG